MNQLKPAYEVTKSALFGQAVGDAFGVPVEFLSRADVRAINHTDMVGSDTKITFDSRWSDIIPAGAWSDDTSMTVATMSSIVLRNGINYDDIMQQFNSWWNKGKYSSLEYSFGLGGTVAKALDNFTTRRMPSINCGPTGKWSNGNGSLMRILPFSLYCIYHRYSEKKTVEVINTASGITHGHQISKMGCLVFTVYLKNLLAFESTVEAWEKTRLFNYEKYYDDECIDAYTSLFSDDFIDHAESVIGETGYVVDTLMTAIYSMLTGHDYESTILTAVNMGYDTDTNAAVAGALAGTFYGLTSIPERWMNKLLKKDLLENTAHWFSMML